MFLEHDMIDSVTEGEDHDQWLEWRNLLAKAIPFHDDLPDPANVREWTDRDLDRLPADQQQEW